jgi:thiol-disulfide isomerase/thioredoxin
MLPLGTSAPRFSLPGGDGGVVHSHDFAGAPLLVMFICNHCPYVQHVAAELARIGRDYSDKLGIVAIGSNDAEEYPEDSPQKMHEEKRLRGYNFPYLYDETQEVAKAYRAACTPDFFLFDRDRKLVYRGQFDESRPDSGIPVSGADLRAAIDAVLSGKKPSNEQRASIGCNIKWIPGNEPDYFG